MEKKTTVQELIELCGLDIDASKNYETAVKNIEVYEIREIMGTFLSDHNRHISYLSDLIQKLGGLAPVNMQSERGVNLKSKLRPVQSSERTRETLETMLANETVINELYASVAEIDLGAEPSSLVSRNYAEEKKHLERLREWVSGRVWDKLPAGRQG